jgi:hypothetical protein
VGAVIGIVMVWASLKVEWVHSGLGTRLLAFMEAKPEIFYAAAFLVSFEMGVIFEDLRAAARFVFDLGRAEHRAFIDVIVLATLGIFVRAAYRALHQRGRRTRTLRYPIRTAIGNIPSPR